MTRKKQLRKQRKGAVTVEAAFVLPILIVMMFAIFEYGRFAFVRNVIDHASREGARFAVVRTVDDGTTSQDILDYVNEQLVGQGGQLENLNIEVYEADPDDGTEIDDWQNAAFGEPIAIRITGDYRPITAAMLFLPTTIPMEALCMMRSEAN